MSRKRRHREDIIPAPTEKASLATVIKVHQEPRKKRKAKRPNLIEGYGQDDTPKEFARLMQFKKVGRISDGLDDGKSRSAKKRKVRHDEQSELQIPKKLPGERLSDFNARVDHALPVAGLVRKGTKVEGVKERLSKHTKKEQKSQMAWRREEAARLEREQDARDLEEEQEAEDWMASTSTGDMEGSLPLGKGQQGAKGRGKGDSDPWAILRTRREEPKGINDIVQEPPQLQKPKEKFKVKYGVKYGISDVPSAAGSLRKREALEDTRKDIIENYRKLMQSKGKRPLT